MPGLYVWHITPSFDTTLYHQFIIGRWSEYLWHLSGTDNTINDHTLTIKKEQL